MAGVWDVQCISLQYDIFNGSYTTEVYYVICTLRVSTSVLFIDIGRAT